MYAQIAEQRCLKSLERESKMANVAKELKALSKHWKSSEAREKADGVPDGTYQAKVTSAGVNRSKNGRLQTYYYFKIVAGKQKGRTCSKYDGLETPENISWLKATLKTMGVKVPKDIVKLPDILEKLEDELVVIQVKTNGDFKNVYINKKIDSLDDDIDEEDEDEEDVEDDDEESEDDEEELEDDEDDDSDDSDDDEDEDEEDEKPAKKKKKKKADKDDDEEDDD